MNAWSVNLRDHTEMMLSAYLAAKSGLPAADSIAAVSHSGTDALPAEGLEAVAERTIALLWPAA